MCCGSDWSSAASQERHVPLPAPYGSSPLLRLSAALYAAEGEPQRSSHRRDPEPRECPLGGAADPNRAGKNTRNLGPQAASTSPVFRSSSTCHSSVISCCNLLACKPPLPPLVASSSADCPPDTRTYVRACTHTNTHFPVSKRLVQASQVPPNL